MTEIARILATCSAWEIDRLRDMGMTIPVGIRLAAAMEDAGRNGRKNPERNAKCVGTKREEGKAA